MENNITIITYHYVRDINKKNLPNLKILEIKKFKKQINYIKKKYNVLSFSQINDCIKQNKDFPKNSCWLTFDDGYKDHIKNVLPILLKNNLTASFFPTVTYNKKNKIMSTNKIQILLAKGIKEDYILDYIIKCISINQKKYKLKKFSYYEKKFKFKNQFDNIKISFVKNLLQNALPFKLRKKIVDNLFYKNIKINEKKFANNFYMSEKDIQNLKKNNMHIGGHGFNHLKLGEINISEQTKEIKKTANFLKKIYGKKKEYVMCYPFGSYNKNTINILKEFNFKLALTTKRKIANFAKESKFELPRLDTNDLII